MNFWFLQTFCSYLKNANGVILTYDVTNRTSFERVPFWRRLVESCDSIESNLVYILIGNKTDLAELRAVTSQEGLQQAGQFFTKLAKMIWLYKAMSQTWVHKGSSSIHIYYTTKHILPAVQFYKPIVYEIIPL